MRSVHCDHKSSCSDYLSNELISILGSLIRILDAVQKESSDYKNQVLQQLNNAEVMMYAT
jgi:hypothetical protein